MWKSSSKRCDVNSEFCRNEFFLTVVCNVVHFLSVPQCFSGIHALSLPDLTRLWIQVTSFECITTKQTAPHLFHENWEQLIQLKLSTKEQIQFKINFVSLSLLKRAAFHLWEKTHFRSNQKTYFICCFAYFLVAGKLLMVFIIFCNLIIFPVQANIFLPQVKASLFQARRWRSPVLWVSRGCSHFWRLTGHRSVSESIRGITTLILLYHAEHDLDRMYLKSSAHRGTCHEAFSFQE